MAMKMTKKFMTPTYIRFNQKIYDYWNKYDELSKNACIVFSDGLYNYYLFQGASWKKDFKDTVVIKKSITYLTPDNSDVPFVYGKEDFNELEEKLYEENSNWVYDIVENIQDEIMVNISLNKQTATPKQIRDIIEQLLVIKDELEGEQ